MSDDESKDPKVVKLAAKEKKEDKPFINTYAIEHLERDLELLKSGEIIAYAAVSIGEGEGSMWHAMGYVSPDALLGRIAKLQTWVAITELSGEVDDPE